MGETSEAGDGDIRSVSLSVPGMDCPSCAKKVEKSLGRVDGVVGTETQVTSGTVTVRYESEVASSTDIVDAVEGAGYEVAGTDGTESSDGRGEETKADGAEVEVIPPTEVWTSKRAVKTWTGAVFLVLGLLFEFVLTTWNAVVVEVALLLVGGSVTFTVADLLFLGAVAASGVPVVRSGYYSARNRSLDIDLLMATAIVAATGIGYYVEAATLAVLFSIAELLEQYAMDRARDSLRELMELSPDEATVVRDGEEKTVPADEVEVGETVVVRPGGKIPLDGVVTDGESAVDESPITGESVPVDKTEGDEVYAGSINEGGYIELKVTSEASDSTLARIIEMVRGAQAKKTEKEQFVDRFAGYYTPVVVFFAVLTAFVPPVIIDGSATVGVSFFAHTFTDDPGTWFVRGLTLLVIACPCAFVISTPVSVVSGITSAAKNGVLIKGGNHLEAVGDVDVIALDKTGTLTKGELTVTDVVPLGAHERDEVLRYAAALERRSEHPIADAVVERADEEGVDNVPEPTEFESLAGRGVRAEIDGTTFYAGKPTLFEGLGFDTLSRSRTDGGTSMDTVALDDVIANMEDEGKTVVLVGTEDELIGVVAVADEVRPGSRRAVERLRELGVHTVMLTGDNEGTARAVAATVGVDGYRAELLPDEKVEAVERLRDEHGEVAMVGDGINDAPALAVADVGVAMGAAGTDTALETADIALMGDEIGKLPYLFVLSRKANGVIRQNIWSSLGVKALLAVGVPFGYVSVAVAVVVGDMGMSLGVTGNAMRLSRLKSD